MENKIFLKSKTIWGVIITALPVLLPTLGVSFGENDTQLLGQIGDTAIELFGLGLAAYGRWTAKTSVSVTGKA